MPGRAVRRASKTVATGCETWRCVALWWVFVVRFCGGFFPLGTMDMVERFVLRCLFVYVYVPINVFMYISDVWLMGEKRAAPAAHLYSSVSLPTEANARAPRTA